MSKCFSLKENSTDYRNLNGEKERKVKIEFWIVMLIFSLVFINFLLLLQKYKSPKVSVYEIIKSYPYAEFHQIHYYKPEKNIFGWNINGSRETAVFVLPNERTELINSANSLPNASQPLFLIIIVTSAPHNFGNREIVRKTWGNVHEFNYDFFRFLHGSNDDKYLKTNLDNWRQYTENPENSDINVARFKIKVFFIVGKDSSNSTNEFQEKLIKEQNTFGDLIQEDFIDHYNNLTLKTLFLFKWVVNHCQGKDDDVFVNIPNLIHILLGGTVPLYDVIYNHIKIDKNYSKLEKSRVPENEFLLLGNLNYDTPVIKNHSSKWFLPNYLFSGEIYPNYLSGGGYVFTYEVAKILFTESLRTPLFPYEDAYMTGFVAERTSLRLIHHQLFKQDASCSKCAMRGFVVEHPREIKFTVDDFKNFVKNDSNRCDII